MGEEFACLMIWQQRKCGDCLKRFETLSFVDYLLPQPTGAVKSISKGQQKKVWLYLATRRRREAVAGKEKTTVNPQLNSKKERIDSERSEANYFFPLAISYLFFTLLQGCRSGRCCQCWVWLGWRIRVISPLAKALGGSWDVYSAKCWKQHVANA